MTLLFDTPLGGTFEFSVEVSQGLWAEGHVGYGGVVFEPNRDGDRPPVRISVPQTFLNAGADAAAGVLLALAARQRSVA